MENILKWCLFVIYEIYIFDSKGDLKFSYNAEGLIREEVVNRFKKLIETLRDFLGEAFYTTPQIIAFYEKKIYVQPFKLRDSNEYLFQIIVCDRLDSYRAIKNIFDKMVNRYREVGEKNLSDFIKGTLEKSVGTRNIIKLFIGLFLYVLAGSIYIGFIESYFVQNGLMMGIGILISIALIILSGYLIGNSRLSSLLTLLVSIIILPIIVLNTVILVQIDAGTRIMLGFFWIAISYMFGWCGGSLMDITKLYDSVGARFYLRILMRFKIIGEE